MCQLKEKYNKLRFTGYNDNYFFNEVSKDFKEMTCRECGLKYKIKWNTSGVIFRHELKLKV